MTTDSKENLIERLFGAGAHFGFGKSRRHPTVVPYLFGSKQGTDIFDLEKTSALLLGVKALLNEAGKKGETVLFVGTKNEAAGLVKEAAESIAMPYVVNRWIGGMLTNFSEMKKRINRLSDLTLQGESGELERKYTKKERVMINRELEKLTFNFSGIKALERNPHYMLVVDPRHDVIAVREARQLDIPVIALSSSDGNLTDITYPVIANDALRASVSLILKELVEAYAEGRKEYEPAAAKDATTRRRA